MNRKIVFAFIACLLCTVMGNTAHAQLFKRLFGKKEKHRRTYVKPTQHALKKPETKTPAIKPKEAITYPETQIKHRYRVDVLLSLYLDELIKNDKPVYKNRVPEKANAGLDFYQGFILAADTLNKQGYNIDLYVHDITSADGTISKLIDNKTLDSSNLIIGALQPHEITQVAKFAKEHTINFASILLPSDAGIKENPYFILMQPTLEAHCTWLADRLSKNYGKETVLLFHRTNVAVDESAYKFLTTADTHVAFKDIRCNSLPPKAALDTLLDSTKNNIIAISIIDNAFAGQLVTQLLTLYPGYHFEIYGMPSWRSMSIFRKPSFPNAAIYFTSAFYYDANSNRAFQLEKNYKSKFAGLPSETVFKGYEFLCWYAYLLTQYGTIFNTALPASKAGPFTRFEVKPVWDKNNNFLYNENQHIYLYKYQGNSYIIQQ